MGIFDRFKRKKNARGSQVLAQLLRGFRSGGDCVTGNDATSFAAIDLICSAFASLSGYFYNRHTRQALKDHPLYELLQNPNAEETKFQFFYNCAKDYFDGNVYLYIYDNDEGEPVSLFRLSPAQVLVQRDPHTNQKRYLYNGASYGSDKILHIPSRWGYDGLKGNSIFNECRKIFTNASELDQFITNAFNNAIGNRLQIDVSKEYDSALSQEQIDEIKRLFIENYAGVKNAGKPLIKSGKVEYSTIQTDMKDNRANQLVENRTFQEKEVSKVFGVPLPLLTGTAPGADLESLYTIFIETAIRPLATSIEQALNRLIPYGEREYIYFEYSYNALMKTSLMTRVDTYTKQLTNGMLNINEVRRKENLPEIEAGNYHFFPANMMPVKEDVIQAYMAKSKEVQQTLESGHAPQGDDKV
ncbi:MAG: phage portal protein [Treponema sp.]|jgi:HK97 family phage portal protein|nr:phage portal protein [Treponema sp.]